MAELMKKTAFALVHCLLGTVKTYISKAIALSACCIVSVF